MDRLLAISPDRPDLAAQFLESLPCAELPHLAEHAMEHGAGNPGDTSEFEFGLDLLLDGLERMRAVT